VPYSATPFVPNAELVQAKLRETRTVAALLGEIFAADDQPTAVGPPVSVPMPAAVPVPVPENVVAGLDGVHTELLRRLARRPSWTRAEFRAAAASVGLLPDGALDVLNEASLEGCGDLVCEGEDPIEMNPAALAELGL
jgi:hypothetical protein